MLETVKPGDWAEVSVGAAVGEMVPGALSIVSLLTIFFVFTGENGLVCYCCLCGGI